MMKRFFFALSALLLAITPLSAGIFQSYPREVKHLVNKIETMPEIQTLYKQIRKDGPIRIKMEKQYDANIEAVWDPGRRMILLNPNNKGNDGTLICSIVFELHNAAANHKLGELSQKAHYGQINKDQYVEGVERIEYENAKNAATLLTKGVQEGRFPKESTWYVYNTFEDHYKIQQIFGHSQWIARQYDIGHGRTHSMPFHGTIHNLEKMSDKDKDELLRYISIKNALESPQQGEISYGEQLLEKELKQLRESNSGRQAELLAIVFEGALPTVG